MGQGTLDRILSGLGINIDLKLIFLIFAVVLLVLVIILLVMNVKQKKRVEELQRRYEAFMQGSNGKSLEDRLTRTARDVRRLDLGLKNQKAQMDELDRKVGASFRKISIVRYNSTNEMGGIMSFALVLLDERNDGFILNVIHAREGSYPYIKRVINGEPEMDLSREEVRALESAMIQN